MGKGLLFFCCSCFILVLTVVNLSIGPITSGTVKKFFAGGYYSDWGTANCKYLKDVWDKAKDAPNANDDEIKYGLYSVRIFRNIPIHTWIYFKLKQKDIIHQRNRYVVRFSIPHV